MTQRSKNYEVEFYLLYLINIVKHFTKINTCNIYLMYFVSSGKHSELKHSLQGLTVLMQIYALTAMEISCPTLLFLFYKKARVICKA